MAYADATRVDANTARMTDTGSVQTNVRAATKTFGEAIEGYMDTHAGVATQEKQEFRDKVIDIMRFLDHIMR